MAGETLKASLIPKNEETFGTIDNFSCYFIGSFGVGHSRRIIQSPGKANRTHFIFKESKFSAFSAGTH